ncbi:hypothetical protein HUT18_29780 [Streptomyces sp. NA04227]|uniref:hypothetical protein n=1 Tax=Streptomyces sp. NA04227 TaxID=2742136 RepID=UPI001590E31B|nr:hypothetical protein [Streptomyces sp. NA04227]QKW09984.1 hypothetical protein HUT18_29780 [Streptomyces sp. NA04227]
MALDDPRHLADGEMPEQGAQTAATSRFPEPEPLVGDELLPCGRPLSHAWEQARDLGTLTDPHAAHCSYCQEAVDGLTALDNATRALGATKRLSAHALTDRVVQAVRAEVRLGAMLPLDDPSHDLRIAESAAARVLRKAADTVPGARAASCRLTATGEGTAVHITMTLAVALDQPLPERAARVRRAVLHAANHRLGLTVTVVDLRIDDVLDPLDASGGEPSEQGGRR